MNKLKVLIFIFLSSWASPLLACPMCGQTSNEGDQYLVYILSVFILLTYIPMYYLYRLIKKNKDLHEQKLDQATNGEGL